MNYLIGLIGMWLMSDAIYSYSIYLQAPGYQGQPKQTWKKDHWVRLVRFLCGVALIIIGGLDA